MAWPRIRLTNDRLRLVISIAANFIARLPNLLAAVLLLPMISLAIGVDLYGQLLSSLALGSAFALFFNGLNTIGRRKLSLAVAHANRAGEANAFVTALTCSAAVTFVLILAGGGASLVMGKGLSAFLLPAVPVVAAFLNTFDNLRVSYNEHYLTAAVHSAAQILVLLLALTFGVPSAGVLMGGLILQGPTIIGSLINGIILITQRGYLLTGKPRRGWDYLREASLIAIADGALFASLNVSVYVVGIGAGESVAAWYGTLVRLFQLVLTPMLLLTLPLSGFVGAKWHYMERGHRLNLRIWILFGSVLYGVGLMIVIALLAPLYIRTFFSFGEPASMWDRYCIALFLGSLAAQKGYAQLIFSLSAAPFLSFGTFFAISSGLVLSFIFSDKVGSLPWLDAFSAITGSLLFLVLAADCLIAQRGVRR